jgi:hypothetical protein
MTMIYELARTGAKEGAKQMTLRRENSPACPTSYPLASSPAEALARAFHGQKVGKGWMACCPAHDDDEPSLSIDDAYDGKVLLYCRPSLHLAPGVLLRGAAMSGAGAGKGLLARCVCLIAFGRKPHAVTAGANADELEKRISSELM